MYKVYKIVVNDEIVYFGRSKDLKKRSYQHNYNLRKNVNREIYEYIKSQGIKSIELIEIASYKSLIQAKRYEAYLILHSYFNGRKLYQKIPAISDR